MEIGKIQINTIGEKEQQGGASGGGDSNMEYLDVSGLDDASNNTLVMMSQFIRTISIYDNILGVAPTGYIFATGNTNSVQIKAIAIDFSAIVFSSGQFDKMTLREMLSIVGVEFDSIPRITKEQFYTL